MKYTLALLPLLLCIQLYAQSSAVTYPYEVKYLPLTIEKQTVQMAYMDIAAPAPNGKSIVLLHGKNFNGYYWKTVIPMLSKKGYRVIVPDQVGWGKSSKPDIHYSFHLLAYNTKKLLDTLGIEKVTVLAHSMGGMLGCRFTLMYPNFVEKLILEDPIGLEDYKTFVPYQTIDQLFENERKATYESYKKYQQSYYPEWKPEYEQYVAAQAASLQDTNFAATALANAITYQMIYEQPVIYEVKNIRVSTLLIIGEADRTVVGKNLLTEDQKKLHGNYPQLGEQVHSLIPNSKLVQLPGVGHIPHVQDFADFSNAVLNFLSEKE